MAKKNDALIRKALETALPEKRDLIEASLKGAVSLSVKGVDKGFWLVAVSPKGNNPHYHSLAYPCNQDGSGVNWAREKFFCENGGTVETAVDLVLEAIQNVGKTDYAAGSEVKVKNGPYELQGLTGRIYEVLGLDEPQRVFGHRYHVRFYDDTNNNFGEGYVAAASFRQSQLELISKPQEASNGG